MKMPKYFTLTVVANVFLFVGLSAILPARAQDDAPKRQGRVVIRTPDGEQVIDFDPSTLPDLGEGKHVMILRAGPNGEFTAFTGNPDMLDLSGGGGVAYNLPGMGNANGAAFGGLSVIDPGVSYLYALLKRVDVATEIHLNARQREALEASETSQQTARQEQLKASLLGIKTGLQGKSKDELTAEMASRAQTMRAQTQAFADSRLKILASILRPEQLARLKQIDLQFRGPMAMGVSEVAQLAALTKEQSTAVTGLLQEYRKEVRKQLGSGTRTISLKPGAAAAPPAPTGPPADTEEERVRLVRADKEIRKSRQALGAKALTVLADEQRAHWAKLTGKPFEFHPAL